MANIPALPTGRALHATVRGTSAVPYGPSGRFDVHADALGAIVLVDGSGVGVIARFDGTDYDIKVSALDGVSVAYVNKFIADYGTVIRDWRTKTYRLKVDLTPVGVAKVLAPAPVATTPVAPSPEPEAPAPAAVPTAPVAQVVTKTAAIAQPKVKVVRKTIAGQAVVMLGSVVIPEAEYDTLEDAWLDRQDDHVAHVLVSGPSGTAKTLTVKAFAQSLGVPFIKMDGGLVKVVDDWFGRSTLVDGTLKYVLNDFGQALKDGTTCVVLLDEANRAQTPQALNAVLGLLDGTKSVFVPDLGETLTLPQGMLVVISANLGAEYTGTVPFDAAVLQRFGNGVRLDYPVEKVEVGILTDITGIAKGEAETLVRMANHQRPLKDDMTQFPSGTGISPRMLIDIAGRRVRRGRDLRSCVVATFKAQFPYAEDQAALTNIIDMYFPAVGNDTLDVDVTAINEG